MLRDPHGRWRLIHEPGRRLVHGPVVHRLRLGDEPRLALRHGRTMGRWESARLNHPAVLRLLDHAGLHHPGLLRLLNEARLAHRLAETRLLRLLNEARLVHRLAETRLLRLLNEARLAHRLAETRLVHRLAETRLRLHPAEPRGLRVVAHGGLPDGSACVGAPCGMRGGMVLRGDRTGRQQEDSGQTPRPEAVDGGKPSHRCCLRRNRVDSRVLCSISRAAPAAAMKPAGKRHDPVQMGSAPPQDRPRITTPDGPCGGAGATRPSSSGGRDRKRAAPLTARPQRGCIASPRSSVRRGASFRSKAEKPPL
jgi:hypothetical protein